METGRREFARARRSDRPIEERRPNRVGALAPPTVNRNYERSLNGDPGTPRSATLEKIDFASHHSTPLFGQKIGLFWPVAFHFLDSIAFAHLLPVSLALFARLAPKAINATVIGLYYLAFFAANSLVGWIGGFLEKWPITNFWLLHAGLAAGSGLCFVLFKFLASHHLQAQE
jgi:hypothetical protein